MSEMCVNDEFENSNLKVSKARKVRSIKPKFLSRLNKTGPSSKFDKPSQNFEKETKEEDSRLSSGKAVSLELSPKDLAGFQDFDNVNKKIGSPSPSNDICDDVHILSDLDMFQSNSSQSSTFSNLKARGSIQSAHSEEKRCKKSRKKIINRPKSILKFRDEPTNTKTRNCQNSKSVVFHHKLKVYLIPFKPKSVCVSSNNWKRGWPHFEY